MVDFPLKWNCTVCDMEFFLICCEVCSPNLTNEMGMRLLAGHFALKPSHRWDPSCHTLFVWLGNVSSAPSLRDERTSKQQVNHAGLVEGDKLLRVKYRGAKPPI